MIANYLRNPCNHRHSGALPKSLKGKVKSVVSVRKTKATFQGQYYDVHQVWTRDVEGNLLKLEEEWRIYNE